MHHTLILPIATMRKTATIEVTSRAPLGVNDDLRNAARSLATYLSTSVSWVFVGALVGEILRVNPTIAKDAEAYLDREKPRARAFRRLKDATDEQISSVLSLLDEER